MWLLLLGSQCAYGQNSALLPPPFAPMPGNTLPERQRYNTLFGELVAENEPLSWISAGGEIALNEHRAPSPSMLNPRYVFSAELRQHFVLVSSPYLRRFQLSVDPTLNMRMRKDLYSWPVKSPSYHIGGWGSVSLRQQIRLRPYNAIFTKATGRVTVPKVSEDIRFSYGQLGFFHYSNGQDGPTMNGNATNESTGNFSTNWIHLAYVAGHRNDFHFQSLTTTLMVGPRPWAEPELLNRYNLTRISLKYTFQHFRDYRYVAEEQLKKDSSSRATSENERQQYVEIARRNKQRFQVDATASYGLSSLSRLDASSQGFGKRLNVELTGVWTPVFAYQAGFFVTVGYYGEDPYNIMFLHQYPFARVGIATGNLRNLWTSTSK